MIPAMSCALLLSLLLTGSARASEPILGFNFPKWSHDAYASSESSEQLRELAKTGAGWVALTPTLYSRNVRDSYVVAASSTPTDDSLRVAIRAARARGLKVVLKPHVDLLNGDARWKLSPADPARWFAAYRAHILGYARLAREEGCSLFVVGTELDALIADDRTPAWKALIADVRRVYSGPLTYASNALPASRVGFWRDLDYIGIDAYYPMPTGTNRAVLRLSWEAIVGLVAPLANANGRPILFTEFGIASQKGANLRPWDYGDFGALDLDVQTAYVETFLAAFSSRSYVAGFLNWDWGQWPGGPDDKSMTLQGKPALQAFEAVIRAAKQNRGLAVPSHAAAAARAAAIMSAGLRGLPGR
jgi:hypothetical protein